MRYILRKVNHEIPNISALIFGIFFASIISEFILQLVDLPARPVSGWLSCKKHHPGQCNEFGFRGREITYSSDDFVVILLGDSELYTRLPFDQIPERRLENFLRRYRDNVKVFTIADMGYGQDQQYLALKKYFVKYRADLVLSMFTVRNDIEDNIYPVSGFNKTIKPTFWYENSEFRGPSEAWLEPVGSRFKLKLILNRFIGQSIGEARLTKWKNDILPRSYQGLYSYKGDVDYSWQEMWNDNPKEALKSLEYEKAGHAGTELTPRSDMRIYGINLTRKLFSMIKQVTEANHGHFIIFKEERPWELQHSDIEKVYYLNGKYYKLSLSQHQATLKDLFDGIEHYRIPLIIDKYTVSSEDEHLNLEAIDILMEQLSFIISKKEYFKKK